MAKKMYIGVDEIARKVKRGYIGVDGVARKIKRGYIGVGGIARICFSGGELAYYGTIDNHTMAISDGTATTVGNYALFHGSINYSTIYAINTSLVISTPTGLSKKVYVMASTTVGNYAIFAGGRDYNDGGSTKYSSTAWAYNMSLTRTIINEYSLVSAVMDLAATTVGDYAIFAGGYNTSNGTFASSTYYNKSLTRSIGRSMGTARRSLAATTVGDYAIFAGGGSAIGYSAAVDVYDKSLVHTSLNNTLTIPRSELAATAVGNHALFGGGMTNDPDEYYASWVVDAYDISLTRSNPTHLCTNRYGLAATTVGEYALFGGGLDGASYYYDAVDAYDVSLTRSDPFFMRYQRGWISAATVGDYAIFAGGGTWDDVDDPYEEGYRAIDIYTIQ